uniref:DUF1995 domain-containing protein n=1 Tax=Craspedostauros australis TaxID=1486917 RepID=A0A7R9WRK6_9STRA|eukprot:CAMPEP_0198130954 /NCGR_PEP_ID=MMETSP1442-20131203/55063_1 /TAXON_ID= /ORGANISM="Craspedostauros australis, Strain CCMP3328" /LENGTH=390 /DNA_ID=CAMNT_0043791675 /DNA_START=80 /DNA_END=1252 /DNA_ORIENTATION=-
MRGHLIAAHLALLPCWAAAFAPVGVMQIKQSVVTTVEPRMNFQLNVASTGRTDTATELPDSLDDAAEIAGAACASFAEATGSLGRCRVDFDTSVGDETYTLLKSSTEFMKKFVSALSYAIIPGLQEQRQAEMIKVAEARAELRAMAKQAQDGDDDDADADSDSSDAVDETRKEELMSILENGGRDPSKPAWEGPIVRVYFPDEGSAALARRDWGSTGSPDDAPLPPCVQFASCGGVQMHDIKKDMLILFFCPKASEAEYVEQLLLKTETESDDLKLAVFVNPNLVDMGVTGFGMAGRMLRERLIDGLVNTYYLRTLQWGALTREWPKPFSVWQEDDDAPGGYKLIQNLDMLPSNPEVEDIYDIANGLRDENKNGGFLDQFGDFVNGMMRL